MKAHLPLLIAASALSLLLPALTWGEEVSASPAAGYFTLTAQPRADTHLAIPLTRRPVWVGRITAVAAGQVTLLGAPLPADGQYSAISTGPAYYAQFCTGALRGLVYPVQSNTGGVFVLDTSADNLTAHALGTLVVDSTAGDIVRIYPTWTIASVWGANAEELSIAAVPAPPATLYLQGDQVRLPDQVTVSVEKSPSTIHAYVTETGWRSYPGGTADSGTTPLLPGSGFVLRRQGDSPASVPVVGYVTPLPNIIRIPALAENGEMDFTVSLSRPGTTTLTESGLNTVLAQSAGDSDRLLSFAPGTRGFDAPPDFRFVPTSAAWYEGTRPADSEALHPGQGYILRLRGARPVRYWRQPGE